MLKNALWQILVLFVFITPIGCVLNARIYSESSVNETTLTLPKIKFPITEISVDRASGGFSLEVSLDQISGSDITLPFQISGSAIGAGVDFLLVSSNTILVPAGNFRASIVFTLIDNGLGDAPKNIILNLGTPFGATLDTNSQAIVTITENPPPLVRYSGKMTDNSSFSYVDIDVDWPRNMAYLGTLKVNNCVDVVDFNNMAAPIVIKSVGSNILQGCRGVKLFDNEMKLLLSSNNSNKLAAWDLTSSPVNVNSWTSLGEYAIGQNGKRIAKISVLSPNNWEIYSTKRFGVFQTSLSVSGGVGTFSLLNTFASALSYNASTVIGNRVLAQSYTGSVEPVAFLNASLVSQTSINTSFWGWTAITNLAGNKSYLAGGAPGGGAFFRYDGSVVGVTKKFIMDSACWVRSADIVFQGSRELVYSLCSNGHIDVFDITDILNPILVKVGQLTSMESEAYAIKVKSNSNTAIVVTNMGDFLIVNLLGLTNPTSQYPVDP